MRAYTVSLLLLVSLVAALAKDKHTARGKRVASCGNLEFQCSNGQCIQQEWLCDTENDCGNNEDEIGCATDCSGVHQFNCGNFHCITIEYRCDGDNDCLNNHDEMGCDTYQCPEGEVKCPNTHLCIENSWICDADDDCGDGWDEHFPNCTHPTHAPH